ncbi:MAG: N-acetyltransferase family protein [Halococcoides sp.]
MATIRPVQADELDELLDLYGHLYEERPGRTPDTEDAWLTLQADDATVVLAAVTDRLVAACQLAIVPAVAREGRPFGVLEYVVTHADHRGEGHGTRVVERAIERAEKQDCYKLVIQTGREDDRVASFYEQCGFDADATTGFAMTLDGD